VIYRSLFSTFSTRRTAILGSLSLMIFACAFAQEPQTGAAPPAALRAQPVPLVSGACPAMRQDGVLSLEWNPGFDPSWGVTGMKSFRLIFQSLREDGVNLNPGSRLIVGSGARGRTTAIGNGYFHLEARLPPSARPGVYRLVGAHSSAAVAPDYTGEAPRATVSPVGESYCITVVLSSRAQAPPLP
jgi:hypothetical protein